MLRQRLDNEIVEDTRPAVTENYTQTTSRSKPLKRIAIKIFDGELRYAQNTFLNLVTGKGRAAVQQVEEEINKYVMDDTILTMGQWRKANGKTFQCPKRDYVAALKCRFKKVDVASEISCAGFANLLRQKPRQRALVSRYVIS